jgi:hypothetical protein
MTEDFYYRAKESRSVQEVTKPDDDSVGLDDFTTSQKKLVEKFAKKSDANILTMGGISDSGKTHFMKELLQEKSDYFYIDLMRLGNKLLVGDVDGVMTQIKEKYKYNRGAKRVILVDESYVGIVDKHNRGKLSKGKIAQLIDVLLEEFPKIVLIGGGWGFTSEEQTEMIVELMPQDIKTLATPYPLKPFNNRQLFEVAKKIKYGIFQWKTNRVVEILPDSLAELLAQMVMPYFRTPRAAVKLMLLVNDKQQFDKKSLCSMKSRMGSSEKYNVKSKIMPEEVFERAWALQLEKIQDLFGNNNK